MTFSCQVWQILEVVMNSVLSVLKEKFEEQISLWFYKKDSFFAVVKTQHEGAISNSNYSSDAFFCSVREQRLT